MMQEYGFIGRLEKENIPEYIFAKNSSSDDYNLITYDKIRCDHSQQPQK